jgi:hypothetical protein
MAMMGGMPFFGARFIPIFRRIYNPGNICLVFFD